MDKEYIPKTLNEAINYLKKFIPTEEQDKIKNGELNPHMAHHFLGRNLRNKWGLWSGSELQMWFKDRGIHFADDMSGIIFESFKRDLQGEDIDPDGQIEHYRIYWITQNINPDTMEELTDQDIEEAHERIKSGLQAYKESKKL